MKVYINSIKFNRSLVDGPGVRTVVFFQGCDLRCKGCQNPSTWEMKNGTEMTTAELVTILEKEVVNKKVTFSGGEPLCIENINEVYDFLQEVKKIRPEFNYWCYTGYTLEELLARNDEVTNKFLKEIDVLVDGRFIEKENLPSWEVFFYVVN